MKKIIVLLILIINMSILSCSSNKTDYEPSSDVYGYFSSIEYMFDSNSSFSDGASILAFDYTNVEIDDTDLNLLKSLIQDFCEEREQTYLEANMDELIQMGYVEIYEFENGTSMPNAFPDGVFIQMTTVSTEENVIVTDMSMWRGSLSAYGSTFTATYIDGFWEVTADGFWVS